MTKVKFAFTDLHGYLSFLLDYNILQGPSNLNSNNFSQDILKTFPMHLMVQNLILGRLLLPYILECLHMGAGMYVVITSMVKYCNLP